MNKARRIHHGWMLVVLIMQLLLPGSSAAAPSLQGTDPETRAQRMLGQLSPEERVGQLFLITFPGTDVSSESQIYDLISTGHIGGIILTMYDSRNNLSQQIEEEVRDHFKDMVCKTIIPRNVRLSEAPSHGKPALLYDIKSKGAQSYLELARELIERGST